MGMNEVLKINVDGYKHHVVPKQPKTYMKLSDNAFIIKSCDTIVNVSHKMNCCEEVKPGFR